MSCNNSAIGKKKRAGRQLKSKARIRKATRVRKALRIRKVIKTRNKMLLQTDATQRATEGKANILVTPAVEILPARILAELASVWSLVFVASVWPLVFVVTSATLA